MLTIPIIDKLIISVKQSLLVTFLLLIVVVVVVHTLWPLVSDLGPGITVCFCHLIFPGYEPNSLFFKRVIIVCIIVALDLVKAGCCVLFLCASAKISWHVILP